MHVRSLTRSRHTVAELLSFEGSAAKWLRDLVLLSLFVIGLTLIYRAAIAAYFNIDLPGDYWLRDFAGNWIISVVIFILLRSLNRTLLLATLFIVLFQLINALKLVILGTPLSPDDFFHIENMFFLMEGWRRWLMSAVVALPFVLAAFFIQWRSISTWLIFLVLACSTLLVIQNSESMRIFLDSRFGNSVWNQPANYKSRGLTLHLTQETIRTIAKTGEIPSEKAVRLALSEMSEVDSTQTPLEPALAELQETAAYIPAAVKRNVHVFVLESFFDPVSLGYEWVPEDPFPESFRALWAETGHSKALSPVFGGYTANAEFELLCGFPVTRNAVFFEGWLRKRVPCLPEVMNQLGYTAMASHPNVPGFWNRTHAYYLLGFDHYLSKQDFDMQESVKGLLLDSSMYQQVFAKIDSNEFSSPVFNYMLTYHGHLPYPSSEQYPDQINAGKESDLLHGYLNQLWYKSRHLMDRLDELQQDDPDALIVIFGDHLPFLGPNYGVYTEAWQLPDDRDKFSGSQLKQLTSTPLIVIDGQRGPLKLDSIPLYRLPSLMMSLLGHQEKQTIFSLSVNPDDRWIRPVYGMHINTNNEATHACTDEDKNTKPCMQTLSWLKRTETLIRDIFTGDQHSLSEFTKGLAPN
ncbi:MAG: LTA synthase family protein [Granulosicoccus sp.]|nr:LTA synthase family protein [Granulosicoccus sp.]